MQSKVSIEEANKFIAEYYGQLQGVFKLTELEFGLARAEMVVPSVGLRAGGSISGPMQMTFADFLAYIALKTEYGPMVDAFTSNLNINFLRPAFGRKMIGQGKVLKLGKRFGVVEVTISGEDNDTVSSHSVATFAMPENSNRGSA